MNQVAGLSLGTKYVFAVKLPAGVDVRALCRKVAEGFNGEPHLLKVSPEELEESFSEGRSMFILTEDGEPIGHTRLVQLTGPLSPNGEWYELGSTWIHPHYRGQNLNVRLYQEFLALHADKNILATTTNEASLAVGRKLGFALIRRKLLPDEVWRASCVCSFHKTGAKDNVHCKLAWGEDQACGGPCWFRVTAETAARLELVSS